MLYGEQKVFSYGCEVWQLNSMPSWFSDWSPNFKNVNYYSILRSEYIFIVIYVVMLVIMMLLVPTY